MSDGDRPAVTLTCWIQTKLAHYSEGLHREGFVEFVKVHVFVLPAGPFPNLADRAHRRHHDPLRLNTAGRLRDDTSHGLHAQFFCTLRAGDHYARQRHRLLPAHYRR